VAVVSLALLAGVLGMPKTARPAAAQDECEKFQSGNDALNRGEIDLVLQDYADDIVFKTIPLCDPVECVGKDAYRNMAQHYVDLNARRTITSCEVSGDTVTVKWEWRDDTTRAAGIDRAIGESIYEVQDDKIVAHRDLPMDRADPQTAQWMDYYAGVSLPDFQLGPGRDANQSPGIAAIPHFPDFAIVYVRIQPGPPGVPQPIHIHEGTCANLGPVAFALGDVGGATSYTVLRGVSRGDLRTGNFAIAVQKSADDPNVYVACGDIPAAAAQVPPVEAAPAPGALPATGSGGLLSEQGSGVPTWWYALLAGGALLIMGGLAGQWRARRRR
jgi:ketosteroid isomerase-like protein